MTYILRKLETSMTLEVCAAVCVFVLPLFILFSGGA